MRLHGFVTYVITLFIVNCWSNTITCSSSNNCQGQTLTCNANEPCNVNCDSDGGQKVCDATNIYQDGATSMTINCLNWLDCRDNYIHCGASTCTLNCGNSNGVTNQCTGTHLLCGTGPCNIYCYSNSCTGLYT
eukprot:752303_1